MNNESIYGLIVIGLFLFFMFSVNRLIDKKLSDIDIKIPKIEIPEQKIIVRMKKKSQNLDPYPIKGIKTVEGFSNGKIIENSRTPKVPYIWDQEVEEKKFENPPVPSSDIISSSKIQKTNDPLVPPYLGRVIGCQRQYSREVYPDQIPPNDPNYKTGENYYRKYFGYPIIPEMTKDKWLPANINDHSSEGPPDRDYRVVPQNYTNTGNKQPLPSNYHFDYLKL